jgi:hypothetical protein
MPRRFIGATVDPEELAACAEQSTSRFRIAEVRRSNYAESAPLIGVLTTQAI